MPGAPVQLVQLLPVLVGAVTSFAPARRSLLLAAAAAICASRARADGESWFADLMGQLSRIPERHARFTEERRFAALTVPLVSQGELVYRRPGHLEKRTTIPRPERLVVDGDTLAVTNAEGGTQTISLADHPEAGMLVDAVRGPLSGDIASLQRHYRVLVTGDPNNWQMSLTPTDPVAARLVRSVTIEGAALSIRVIAIVQANGDTQRMTIQDAA